MRNKYLNMQRKVTRPAATVYRYTVYYNVVANKWTMTAHTKTTKGGYKLKGFGVSHTIIKLFERCMRYELISFSFENSMYIAWEYLLVDDAMFADNVRWVRKNYV